jgi:hypothetical protein
VSQVQYTEARTTGKNRPLDIPVNQDKQMLIIKFFFPPVFSGEHKLETWCAEENLLEGFAHTAPSKLNPQTFEKRPRSQIKILMQVLVSVL